MIGQIKFIGKDMYLQVNQAGTLEKLPPVKWYKQIYLYILSRRGTVNIDIVRKIAQSNDKGFFKF